MVESLQNAQSVKDALITTTIELTKDPGKHPLDKFKIDNDGSWRAFEKNHYRISYPHLSRPNPYCTQAAHQPFTSYLLIC